MVIRRGNMKVAFIGQVDYRERELIVKLKDKVKKIVENLIVEKGADEFIFGSIHCFNEICYDVVTELKIKYPHIQRFRMNMFKLYSIEDTTWLNKNFDSWKNPERDIKKGELPGILLNQRIIDECDYLISYYDKNRKFKRCYYEEVKVTTKDNQTMPKSQVKVALNYAFSNNVDFVNLFEE